MSLNEKLRELKAALDDGLMDRAEYERLRAQILDIWQRPPAGAAPDPHATAIPELRPDLELGPGDNRYRLVKWLGGGGMGQVWLARDLAEETVTGRECLKAVKLVHPEMLKRRPRAEEDLKKEAIQARDLRHDHIVAVHGWRRGDDGWALVNMEHLEGGTLRDLLADEGTPGLPLVRVLELLRPLVDALEYAHARGVIHRDIKPDNVMLARDGVVKLVDFGLAFQLRRTASASGLKEALPLWTPEYVAPEVARFNPEPEPRHDVYSLACLTWELLVGKPPFSPEMAYHRAEHHQPPRGALSERLYGVLRQGFAFRPEARPDGAAAFLELLTRDPKPVLPPVQFIHGWNQEGVWFDFVKQTRPPSIQQHAQSAPQRKTQPLSPTPRQAIVQDHQRIRTLQRDCQNTDLTGTQLRRKGKR